MFWSRGSEGISGKCLSRLHLWVEGCHPSCYKSTRTRPECRERFQWKLSVAWGHERGFAQMLVRPDLEGASASGRSHPELESSTMGGIIMPSHSGYADLLCGLPQGWCTATWGGPPGPRLVPSHYHLHPTAVPRAGFPGTAHRSFPRSEAFTSPTHPPN